jgi:hypothetical protein
VIVASGSDMLPFEGISAARPGEDGTFIQVVVEYGLIEGLTLGGRLSADISASDPTDGELSAGLHARKRLWHDPERGHVVSAEVFGSLPAERLVSHDMARSAPDSTPEAGVALLAGTSWWGDWGSAWAGASAGYAWRSERQPDEIRGELTGGYRPWLCCAAILGLYGVQPLAGDDDPSLTIAPSLAWTMRTTIARNAKKPAGGVHDPTLQLGLSYDVLSRGDGLGFQIAWWRPF